MEMNQNQIMELLDTLYAKSINGIPINIVKLVPVVGGVIGGEFDLVETKVIANRAYKMFIKGDFSALDDKDDDEIIDVDIDNIETPADKSNS